MHCVILGTWLCLSGISFPHPQHEGMGEDSYPGSFQLSGSGLQGVTLYIPWPGGTWAKVFKSVITRKDRQETLGRDAGRCTVSPAPTSSTPGSRGRARSSPSQGQKPFHELSNPVLPTCNKLVLRSSPNSPTFPQPQSEAATTAKSRSEERERAS